MLMLRSPIRSIVSLVAMALVAWAAIGCGGTSRTRSAASGAGEEGSGGLSEDNRALARGCLAATEIHGQPLVTVQETVESVFTAAGLAMYKRNADEIGFERPATRRERGAYGSWYGTDIRVRLRVEIQRQGGGVHFLRCRSFIVRDAGTQAEDQQSLARRHVRNYEHLLDEVATRLN